MELVETSVHVAVALKWRENDVVWFATLDHDITIILAIRKDVGLDTIHAESSDIDSVLMGLANATEEGELQFTVNGHLIQLNSMFACYDLDCQDTYLLRKATYTDVSTSSTNDQTKEGPDYHYGTAIGLGVFGGVILLVVCFFFYRGWKLYRDRSEDTRHFMSEEENDT